MKPPRAFARFVYRWRLVLSAAIVIGAIAAAPSADLTSIDNDISAWISRDDPVYQTYERFRKEFGGTRNLIIAIKSDRIFTPEGLQFIDRASHDIERVQLVDSVQSLATANIVRPLPPTAEDDGGIEVQPLLEDRAHSSAGADQVRRDALDDPLLRGDLVSEDGTLTAIVVTFNEDRIDEVRGDVIARVRRIVDGALPAGFSAYYNGSLEISETYNRVTIANTKELTPPIGLLTLAGLYIMFRSVRKTLLIALAVGVSVLWTLGLYAAMGFSFNVLTSMLAPLVVVLAIADDVHIVQHFDHVLRETGSKEEAFTSAITHLLPPLLGASGTTALGMLSLATSDVVAVKAFGVGAAVGVMVDFVMSVVFVPTLLTLVKPDPAPPPQERWLMIPLQKAGRFSYRHPALMAGTAAVVSVAAIIGVSHLRVDTNHINFFAAGHPLAESAAIIDRDLSGIYSFNILLEGPPESLRTPDAFARIERLSNELERLPHVRKVTSVVNYVKRINQQLSNGDRRAFVVPASAEAIAQELFVFGLSDEGRTELARVVASDYSRAQISIKLASMSSDLVFAQIAEAERLAEAAFTGSDIVPTVTGSGRIFSTLDHYLVVSQLSSFGTAFLTVFGVIFLVFRSARFGLLGIVANAFPVIVVLGIMGWFDISLNVATVMVASVALGIVDDDTIHFIGRYRRELVAGRGTEEAVELASMHEGRAALTTTIVNAMGYSVLMVSEYRPTAWFGSLLATTMLLAFIAEVFIVPAMIALLPRLYSAEAFKVSVRVLLALLALLATMPAAVWAQTTNGQGSVMLDVLPNATTNAADQSAVTELRARVLLAHRRPLGERFRMAVEGYVEGVLGDRNQSTASRAAALRPQELYLEGTWSKADLRVGFTRIVWGRLDEFLPTDVVNPQDLSRFFLEGRAEGRLPVALVRGRWIPSDRFTLEAVYVPIFRRGRFDQLDEETSPFNLAPRQLCVESVGCSPIQIDDMRPEGWRQGQGGVRASLTTGRIDWALSAYRGLEPFPVYTTAGGATEIAAIPSLLESFPRFTMLGADFETVFGQWGVRGEVAGFVSRTLQLVEQPLTSVGKALEVGLGVDRKAGDYRVSSNAILTRRWANAPLTGPIPVVDRTDVTLVAAIDRTFARETRRLRAFAAYNPGEDTAFTRVIGSISLRDNVSLDASIGWFTGEGSDALGRLSSKDFAYSQLKVFF